MCLLLRVRTLVTSSSLPTPHSSVMRATELPLRRQPLTLCDGERQLKPRLRTTLAQRGFFGAIAAGAPWLTFEMLAQAAIRASAGAFKPPETKTAAACRNGP